ncbi:MAG: outer membrane beta-barrel protein, partial [Opitutales bacterium]
TFYIAALMGTATLAQAEYQIGDAGALAIGLDASVQSTDNVTMDSSADSDTITSILPTLNYKSDAGAMSIEAFVGQEIITYSDLSENDSEDFKSNIKLSFPDELAGENFSLVLEGGVNEFTRAVTSQAGQGRVVSTEATDLSLDARYYIDEYTTLRVGATQREQESQTTGYFDVDTLTIPVAVYFDLDDSISVGVGYRQRMSEVDSLVATEAADSDDQAFFLGLENELSSIWSYALELGYQQREFDNAAFDDEDGLFASFELNWQLSDMSELSAELSNEFGTTLANQSSETARAAVQLNHTFDERISAALGLSFEEVNYEQLSGSREDELFSSFLTIDYQLLEGKWVLRGSVSYDDSSSSAAAANYDAVRSGISSIVIF